MKKATLKKENLQTLDLSVLEGEGSFPCPHCGTMISPDDESEEVYRIVETKMDGGELAELVISCGTCGSIIRLVGFQKIVAHLTSE